MHHDVIAWLDFGQRSCFRKIVPLTSQYTGARLSAQNTGSGEGTTMHYSAPRGALNSECDKERSRLLALTRVSGKQTNYKVMMSESLTNANPPGVAPKGVGEGR